LKNENAFQNEEKTISLVYGLWLIQASFLILFMLFKKISVISSVLSNFVGSNEKYAKKNKNDSSQWG